jgi:hypothetical protein
MTDLQCHFYYFYCILITLVHLFALLIVLCDVGAETAPCTHLVFWEGYSKSVIQRIIVDL